MDATTMPSLRSLVKQLSRDFPDVTFVAGDDFVWSPDARTVTYRSSGESAPLLHELSHALLGHTDYEHDIDLLAMETSAWQHAEAELAPKYKVSVTTDHIEAQLDSYRDWLHLRSLCPSCRQTGLQTQTNRYSCMNCNGSWRVNDARRCRLRRDLITTS